MDLEEEGGVVMQTDTGRVLIVDDEPVVCRSFKRVLSDAGYDVHTETTGQNALATFGNKPFDLVLTDLKLPDINGLEVTRHVREARPEVPVMIVTGYGSPESELEAEQLGVFKYLRKPISPDALREVTADALASTFGATAGALALPADAALPFPFAPARPIEKVENVERVVEQESAVPQRGVLTNLALLVAAPFLGLAYVIFLPFIGFGMLAAVIARSLRKPAGAKERA
jgi:CheY-like chemotaxis protein